MSEIKFHQEILELSTNGRGLTDITSLVQKVLRASQLTTGLCVVFVQHTSASLVIEENADPTVLRDLQRWIERVAPESSEWVHDSEGPDDMPSHLRTALLKTSETIPVSQGKLALGTWQGIYFWEHRTQHHQRRIFVHLMGT